METETAENFFANLEWFARFFQDIKWLLRERVKESLKKEGYTGDWSGYPKEMRDPTMPTHYTVTFEGSGRPRVQVTALLRREWGNEDIPVQEPMLMVVVHDLKREDFGVSDSIRDYTYIKEFKSEGAGLPFAGILDWKEPVGFHGFFVPLDAFNDKNCQDELAADRVIQEKIVVPLRAILDEHFSKPGKKPKTGA